MDEREREFAKAVGQFREVWPQALEWVAGQHNGVKAGWLWDFFQAFFDAGFDAGRAAAPRPEDGGGV